MTSPSWSWKKGTRSGLKVRVARRPSSSVRFKEGDIQFLNNRMIVHGRTDYQDAPELENRRHLLRLWIQVPPPVWPAMPARQIFHTEEGRRLWSQYRQPFGEMPSIHYQKLLEGVHNEMVD